MRNRHHARRHEQQGFSDASALGLCLALVSLALLLAPAPALTQHHPDAGASAASQQASKAPTVSPYINLYRDNLPPVFNYYTLVRPPMQQQAYNAREGVAMTRLQRDLG